MADANAPLLATETRKQQKEEVVYIPIVGSDSSSRKTYKPELICIGPYYRKEPAGTENSVKEKFQKSFFGKNEKLKVKCRKTLENLENWAGFWYAQNMGLDGINDGGQFDLAEMLLLDGCFILEFFYTLNSLSSRDADFKNVGDDDKEVVQTINAFMGDYRKVAQTLSDLLLFESQFPFVILFELHNLKYYNYYGDSVNHHHHHNLLQGLMVMVKKSFMNHVPKLTPLNVAAHEDRPTQHLLQLVHSLCIPLPSNRNNTCGGNTEQINTATELEQDGVRFKKIGKIYQGYYDDKERPNFNAHDGTTLFDIDFSWGRLIIPCFKIEHSTETFFRNMIAFEQQSASAAPKYFTDFAWCMGQLIRSQNDVILLRRKGIIVNFLATDDMVAKMFHKLAEAAVISSTFSQVYSKVNWFSQRPWKLISVIVGGLTVSLGIAGSVKGLLK